MTRLGWRAIFLLAVGASCTHSQQIEFAQEMSVLRSFTVDGEEIYTETYSTKDQQILFLPKDGTAVIFNPQDRDRVVQVIEATKVCSSNDRAVINASDLVRVVAIWRPDPGRTDGVTVEFEFKGRKLSVGMFRLPRDRKPNEGER
jgi:hypothetical protein